jgi:putative hydrolase of the HAD superfamily
MKTLIFDLDNTVYKPCEKIDDQFNSKISTFLQAKLNISLPDAFDLQQKYYIKHGSTLIGLMENHQICPYDYDKFVHDLDVSSIPYNKKISDFLANYSGKKYIYTNASTRHAEKVLAHMKLDKYFDDIYDIFAAELEPKPALAPYNKFLDLYAINPKQAIMFEDLPQNLQTADSLGVTTVLVNTITDHKQGYIHHTTNDLGSWLHENDVLTKKHTAN